jgi:hypothetical protein
VSAATETQEFKMAKQKLLKRLRHLKWVELVNVFWVPLAVWLMSRNAKVQVGAGFWASASLCSFLLLQGSVFWFIAYYKLRTRKAILIGKWYLFFKTTNLSLLLATLIICVFNLTEAVSKFIALFSF